MFSPLTHRKTTKNQPRENQPQDQPKVAPNGNKVPANDITDFPAQATRFSPGSRGGVR